MCFFFATAPLKVTVQNCKVHQLFPHSNRPGKRGNGQCNFASCYFPGRAVILPLHPTLSAVTQFLKVFNFVSHVLPGRQQRIFLLYPLCTIQDIGGMHRYACLVDQSNPFLHPCLQKVVISRGFFALLIQLILYDAVVPENWKCISFRMHVLL